MQITKDNYKSKLKRMESLLEKEETEIESLTENEESELSDLINSIEKYETENFTFEKMSKDLKKLKDSTEAIGIITDKGECLFYSNNTLQNGRRSEK